MSDAAYIEQAERWARSLTSSESRGPGDLENAWHRLEAKYDVPFGLFWSLRYRKPKELVVSAYFRLQAAYQAECDRQMRKLKHDLELTKAVAGPDDATVHAAQALVDADNS